MLHITQNSKDIIETGESTYIDLMTCNYWIIKNS